MCEKKSAKFKLEYTRGKLANRNTKLHSSRYFVLS